MLGPRRWENPLSDFLYHCFLSLLIVRLLRRAGILASQLMSSLLRVNYVYFVRADMLGPTLIIRFFGSTRCRGVFGGAGALLTVAL